jgi:hypothetical protein
VAADYEERGGRGAEGGGDWGEFVRGRRGAVERG